MGEEDGLWDGYVGVVGEEGGKEIMGVELKATVRGGGVEIEGVEEDDAEGLRVW